MKAALCTGLIAALAIWGLVFDAQPAQARAFGPNDSHAVRPEDGQQPSSFSSERLHVRVDGPAAARDIILIAGLSSSPQVWEGTVAHLGSSWRVNRIHVQGFAGAAPEGNATGPVAAPVAEEIARYIRETGLDRPVVVGHSMGGTIGLMLAARHPDLVGKLMVVDMMPFMGAMFGPPGATADSVTPVADQIYQAMRTAAPSDYSAQAEATVTAMVNNQEGRALALADSRASDQQVSSAAYRELIITDLRSELANITAPTEVVYVKFNDPRMTPEITDMLYRASYRTLPGVTLKRIDDAAHFVFLDQPSVFNSELDAFLAQ